MKMTSLSICDDSVHLWSIQQWGWCSLPWVLPRGCFGGSFLGTKLEAALLHGLHCWGGGREPWQVFLSVNGFLSVLELERDF